MSKYTYESYYHVFMYPMCLMHRFSINCQYYFLGMFINVCLIKGINYIKVNTAHN